MSFLDIFTLLWLNFSLFLTFLLILGYAVVPVVEHVIHFVHTTKLRGQLSSTQKDALEKLYLDAGGTTVRHATVYSQKYSAETSTLAVTTRLYVDQPQSTSTFETAMTKFRRKTISQLEKYINEDLELTVKTTELPMISVESMLILCKNYHFFYILLLYFIFILLSYFGILL